MDEEVWLVEKGRVVRYELIPLFAILALAIGFGIFYFQHRAQKMDDNGIALNIMIKSSEDWSQPFELYLKKADNSIVALKEDSVIQEATIRKIVLFDTTAELIFKADNKEYILVSGIDGRRREELSVTLDVTAKEDKLNFDTTFRFDPLVDFSLFN
jgi:hypothetical protein